MVSRVITARNVNHAYHEGLNWLKVAGEKEPSRNGDVLVAPGPVITEYLQPRERVLWHPVRDANPVFHLVECLWMLAGSNSVHALTPYNKRMVEYSDNGVTVHGAYGYRWRSHFGVDQLVAAIHHLRKDPASRRCVIAMWDPREDLNVQSKDLPCNTHIYLDTRGAVLNMTVCCRSNDVIWGAYGANAVHFSFLQEFVANCLGMPVGTYRQMSNNFHVYTGMPKFKEIWEEGLLLNPDDVDRYLSPGDLGAEARPFEYLCKIGEMDSFLHGCRELLAGNHGHPSVDTNPFLATVAAPLVRCYNARRAGTRGWFTALERLPANVDWVHAFKLWCERREGVTITQ